LQMYTTSKDVNMEVNGPLTVKNGSAVFKIPATSYVTLISQ
jgi:hypothetical protein